MGMSKVYDERPTRNGSAAQKAWDYLVKNNRRNSMIRMQYVEAQKGWEAKMTASCPYVSRPVTRFVASRSLR
jgi:hypothetical protein